jgi:hypothetical protein
MPLASADLCAIAHSYADVLAGLARAAGASER